jgi:hypothetical protein
MQRQVADQRLMFLARHHRRPLLRPAADDLIRQLQRVALCTTPRIMRFHLARTATQAA